MSMGVDRARPGLDLGAAIRRRRAAEGVSVARLAEEIGVPPSEVRSWERGLSTPSPALIRAIARALRADDAASDLWPAAGESPDEVRVIIDLAPPDPFVVLKGGRDVPPPRPPQPVVPVALSVAEPEGRAAVFPTPRSGWSRDRFVYATGTSPGRSSRLASAVRLLRTVLALAVLGLALAWAMSQLGDGLGDVARLFRGSGG